MFNFLTMLGHQFNINVSLTATCIRWVLESMDRAFYYKATTVLRMTE